MWLRCEVQVINDDDDDDDDDNRILFILAIGHKNDSEQKRTRGDKIT